LVAIYADARHKNGSVVSDNAVQSTYYMAKLRRDHGREDVSGNYMLNDYSWYFIMIPIFDLTTNGALCSPSEMMLQV
jgi:hypothetical protein